LRSNTVKGNQFCIFKLEDQSSGVKCLAWSEAYSKFSESLRTDELLIVDGKGRIHRGQEITMMILEEVKKLCRRGSIQAESFLGDRPEERF